MSDSMSTWNLEQEVILLKNELAEANSEIARHHRDFEAIRTVLDVADALSDGMHSRYRIKSAALRDIRGIVG